MMVSLAGPRFFAHLALLFNAEETFATGCVAVTRTRGLALFTLRWTLIGFAQQRLVATGVVAVALGALFHARQASLTITPEPQARATVVVSSAFALTFATRLAEVVHTRPAAAAFVTIADVATLLAIHAGSPVTLVTAALFVLLATLTVSEALLANVGQDATTHPITAKVPRCTWPFSLFQTGRALPLIAKGLAPFATAITVRDAGLSRSATPGCANTVHAVLVIDAAVADVLARPARGHAIPAGTVHASSGRGITAVHRIFAGLPGLSTGCADSPFAHQTSTTVRGRCRARFAICDTIATLVFFGETGQPVAAGRVDVASLSE